MLRQFRKLVLKHFMVYRPSMNEDNRFSRSNVLNIDMDSIRSFNLIAQLFFFSILLFEHFYRMVQGTITGFK